MRAVDLMEKKFRPSKRTFKIMDKAKKIELKQEARVQCEPADIRLKEGKSCVQGTDSSNELMSSPNKVLDRVSWVLGSQVKLTKRQLLRVQLYQDLR